MTKQELVENLALNHQKFICYFSGLDDQDFMFSFNDTKWSAGEQADHIYRSLSPLNLLLTFPKWLLKLVFPKAKRPSSNYEKLVEKYNQRLAQGGVASGRFVPGKVEPLMKKVLAKRIGKISLKLSRSVEKYGEEELDELIIPHPLLGKITLREMLYFTIYHVEHHHKLTICNLAAAK